MAAIRRGYQSGTVTIMSVPPRRTSLLSCLLLLVLLFLAVMSACHISVWSLRGIATEDRTWHGGHPAQDRYGSCWCGHADGYCGCTPAVSVDIVLYSKRETGSENGSSNYLVWVVRRKDTGQLGTIGGFVDVGETPMNAAVREVKEETGIILPTHMIVQENHGGGTSSNSSSNMRLIGVYSDPRRDSRRSNISISYAVEYISSEMVSKDEMFVPKAGDDAKEIVAIALEDVGVKYKGDDWFADHLTILLDFKEQMLGEELGERRYDMGELSEDVARSTCGP